MKCDELKDKWFNAYPEIMGIEGTEPTKCYGKADVDAAITELKANLEDVQASAYAESVDAGMRERKLKRALWLARAERAVAKQAYYDILSRGISSERGEMYDVWNNVERKCRAKAEEYK